MSQNSRKPVCPMCHGVGHWHATRLDPSEDCELCGGAGRVSKRTARRYQSRVARRKRSPQINVAFPTDTMKLLTDAELNDILNAVTF